MDDVEGPTGPGIEDPAGALPPAPEAPARRRRLRWAVAGVVAAAVAGGGAFAWTQVKPVVDARRYSRITYEVPTAPTLTAKDGETIYRIDPTRSSLTYAVDEQLVGQTSGTATGVTNGIAGDLAVNGEDLAASRVGDIVVNIEQFHSDNNLRDSRLRQDYLQSHRYPLATFSTQTLDGLAGTMTYGKTYHFTMAGLVAIKDTTATVEWDVTATLKEGRLKATATTEAKLSRFDAGPISIAGLVSTSDDVKLTLELTALDPSKYDIPTTISGPDAVETKAVEDAPSFKEEVLPIIEDNCASCHTSGQMAAQHVLLDTAGDVQAVSDGIKTVTQSGYMPPWPASDEGVELSHVARLSKKELATLAAWSDGGGQLDVAADTPIEMPKAVAAAQPRDDYTGTLPGYAGSLANANDYRCFVVDPKVTEDTYLTGYRFTPDQIQEVHHVQVFQISDEQLAYSANLDGKDGKPGWSCYSGPNLLGRRPDRVAGQPRQHDVGFAGQPNLVAGWVPGQSPVIYPQNSGILLHKGDALVVQMHYHYADTPVPDASTIELQLDKKADSPTVRPLRVVNPLAPVEIPCAPKDQDEPLCDRDAAIAENEKLYGGAGANNEAGLLALCHKTPEELTAGFDGTVARSSCTTTVPEDGEIVGIMGHMHTLGKSIKLTLDKGTADEQVLLDIPHWSFDWQMNYGLAEPLHVKAGQKIEIECAWDRSIDPLRAPKYIVFAEGTEDEMCFATYSLLPDD